jgi:hypothetical protein
MRPMVCRPDLDVVLRNDRGQLMEMYLLSLEGRATFEWKGRVNVPLSAGNKKVKTESGLNFASNILRSISTEPLSLFPTKLWLIQIQIPRAPSQATGREWWYALNNILCPLS